VARSREVPGALAVRVLVRSHGTKQSVVYREVDSTMKGLLGSLYVRRWWGRHVDRIEVTIRQLEETEGE
jgi:hypothetical protein